MGINGAQAPPLALRRHRTKVKKPIAFGITVFIVNVCGVLQETIPSPRLVANQPCGGLQRSRSDLRRLPIPRKLLIFVPRALPYDNHTRPPASSTKAVRAEMRKRGGRADEQVVEQAVWPASTRWPSSPAVCRR